MASSLTASFHFLILKFAISAAANVDFGRDSNRMSFVSLPSDVIKEGRFDENKSDDSINK